MYCRHCGKNIPDDSAFCTSCGKKILNLAGEANSNNVADVLIATKEKTLNSRGKNKRVQRCFLIAVVLLVIVVWIVAVVRESRYNSMLRNMATEYIDDDFTNVYADVVRIEPVYFVYEYKTSSTGYKIGTGTLIDVVCKCQTVEGKIIWATIFYQDYPYANNSKYEDAYKILSTSSDKPVRLTGVIDRPEQVAKDFNLKGELVLDVRSITQ